MSHKLIICVNWLCLKEMVRKIHENSFRYNIPNLFTYMSVYEFTSLYYIVVYSDSLPYIFIATLRKDRKIYKRIHVLTLIKVLQSGEMNSVLTECVSLYRVLSLCWPKKVSHLREHDDVYVIIFDLLTVHTLHRSNKVSFFAPNTKLVFLVFFWNI